MLHAAIYLLLPVSIFTLTVWATYLAYLDPDRVNAPLCIDRNEIDDAIDRLDKALTTLGEQLTAT